MDMSSHHAALEFSRRISAGGPPPLAPAGGPAWIAAAPLPALVLGHEVAAAGPVVVLAGLDAAACAAVERGGGAGVRVRIYEGESHRDVFLDDALGAATENPLVGALWDGLPTDDGLAAVLERTPFDAALPYARAAEAAAIVRALEPLLDEVETRRLRERLRAVARESHPCEVLAFAACRDASPRRVLPFVAQPAEPYPGIDLPEPLELLALERAPPAVAPPELDVACAMAYRIVAERCGMTIHTGERGEAQVVEDPYFGGYLCNVDPVTFASEMRDALPESMAGREFLDLYGGLASRRQVVCEEKTYPVRAAAVFAVGENQRACTFVDALGRDGMDDSVRARILGAQMEQSYLAWREFLPVDESADFVVTELRRRGPDRGILGVRPHAGGWPVTALLRRDADGQRSCTEAVAAFERRYRVAPRVHRTNRTSCEAVRAR